MHFFWIWLFAMCNALGWDCGQSEARPEATPKQQNSAVQVEKASSQVHLIF